MRIAMIGLRGLPATYGGVEKHVEELGARLSARGHDVTIYCRPSYSTAGVAVPPEHDYLAPTGRSLGHYRGMTLRTIPTSGGKHLESAVHSGLSAAHTVWSRSYDVVHFHAMGPGIFSPLPSYLSPSRVVQTIHALDDQRAKWSPAARLMLRAGRALSTRVPDEVVVVSRDMARIYREEHGREARYIPNGAQHVTPAPPGPTLARLGLTPGNYVVFLGRLVPEKQPDQLVRAFARVPGATRLVVVGDSSHTDAFAADLRDLADLDPRVVLPGYLFGRDLAEVMTSAGVFVQPSTLEGMPITLLEAAAYGRRVVVSDIPPHREIVGSHAPGHRIVPAASVSALTDAIVAELSGDEAGATGARRLRADVLARYDWDAITDEVLSVYRATLAR
ncbi:MAG: glycosyltransferase family 4 protein [Tetrasphaera sp.]|nr:glycosyltransferase family 4 protein [Tetrasphaera sp.]